MHWDGSTARDTAGPGLSWSQVEEMAATGLCRVENHTHSHPRPDLLSTDELDRCSDEVERRVGRRPRHFAFTWGVPVPDREQDLRARFRTAATGRVGALTPRTDLMALPRVPVRGSDPREFFRRKVTGNLWQEQAYGALVRGANRLGAHG
jgi:peptidoglycan/xylan/chitin deacetylase (PgdA/CDA1 family)